MKLLSRRGLAGLAESPFWPMLWKEFVQMRRDRLTLAMLVVIPAIQLIVFGFAIRTEVRNLRTVVLDESRSSESRALVDVMRNTGNFAIVGTVDNRTELRERIERGSAQAAIVIPPEYQRDLKRGRTAQVQVIIDAADPQRSSTPRARAPCRSTYACAPGTIRRFAARRSSCPGSSAFCSR
jgi:ABC-2 type transport system permease protein